MKICPFCQNINIEQLFVRCNTDHLMTRWQSNHKLIFAIDKGGVALHWHYGLGILNNINGPNHFPSRKKEFQLQLKLTLLKNTFLSDL